MILRGVKVSSDARRSARAGAKAKAMTEVVAELKKKRAPARQTPGVVAELVFKKKTNQVDGPTNWAN